MAQPIADPTADSGGKPRPWLIAAWPGMGSVALIAAGYLVHQLGAEPTDELPLGDWFDVNEVEVGGGLLAPIRVPRGVFHRLRNPGRGRDLVIFLSEAQPTHRRLAYGSALVDAAVRMDVERIVTFASLASGLHPSENPKVTGLATDASTLAELRKAEVEPIETGQIGGMNGLLLAVAASRGIGGMCFLAEIPFFAMNVPNPKAARAALSVFSVLAEVDVSLDALSVQAAMVDRALIDAMRKIEEQQDETSTEQASDAEGDAEDEIESEQKREAPAEPAPSKLDAAGRARIEQLFEVVRRNPSEAVKLKAELDRLGVFADYEGRFLDLFRRAE